MEIKSIEDKKNPLLKRREIQFRINHDAGTPARGTVKDKLATMLNAKPELVIVERMSSEFGKREAYGYVKVYSSEKALKAVERSHIIKRNVAKPPEKTEEKAEEKPKQQEPAAKVPEKVEGAKKVRDQENKIKTETKSKDEEKPKEE